MELPLEKLLEESRRFGRVCAPDFNKRNNIDRRADSVGLADAVEAAAGGASVVGPEPPMVDVRAAGASSA
jgi:hypothetical protein